MDERLMSNMAFKVEVCPPCNSLGYDMHDIRNSAVRKWLYYANVYGSAYSMNPGLLLAVVSIESGGVVSAGPYYGLTQIGTDMLNTYNKAKNTKYTTADLRGNGSLITTENAAGGLAIKIFAEFISRLIRTLDGATDTYTNENLIKHSTTNWNGSICGGEVMNFTPFTAENGGTTTTRATRLSHSCYGQNVYNLMNYASAWCGTSPWYSNQLSDVSFTTTYRKAVGQNV